MRAMCTSFKKKPGKWCNMMGMWKIRCRGECKAKIELDEAGNFLERINNHTHAPSETKCEISKVRANIKRKATETQDLAQAILERELGGESEAAAINLPALHHIRRIIRLQRQANQQLPSPANRQDVLALSSQYQWSYTNEQYLIFDSGQVMLIEFSSLELTKVSNYFHSHKTSLMMELLRFVSRYFFKYTLFNHKLTERILPCIYALLPNKTDTRLSIPEVEQHVANSPTDILVELKQAASKSVLQVYPNTKLKGLPFLIKYMEPYSKPWSTKPLSRRWKLCFVALYAFCTSFRTTKWYYTLFWITDRRNLQ